MYDHTVWIVFDDLFALSENDEIKMINQSIALKFDKHLGSTVAERPVKYQSDTIIITSNLAASRLYVIWWWNNKTVLLRDTVHQISLGESAAGVCGQPGGRGLPSGDLVDRIT